MSIEIYEHIAGCFELYSHFKEGLDNIVNSNTCPLSDAMIDIRSNGEQ